MHQIQVSGLKEKCRFHFQQHTAGLALSTLIKLQFLFTSDELFWRDVVQFAGQGQYVIFSI